jgi:hypothetical protein
MRSYSRSVTLLLLLFAAVAVTTLAPAASASRITQELIFQDCGTGCPEPVDMAGPTGFGWVNYYTIGDGDLKVTVALHHAEPNTTYEIFLVCGPTHDTACGFTVIGSLTTDAYGRGRANQIIVRLATLQAPPYGSGDRTDHIDLLKSAGDLSGGLYAAGNINYTVP